MPTKHSNSSTDRLLLSTPFSPSIHSPPPGHAATRLSDEEQAGILSKATLSWLSRVMGIGWKRALQFDDVCPLPTRHRAPRLPRPINANDTLDARLYRFVMSRGFFGNGLLMLIADVSTYVTPVLQAQLLSLIEARSEGAKLIWDDYAKGVVVCLGMFGLQCINTFAINLYYKKSMCLGMEIRAAVQYEVYEKLVTLPDAQTGQLINLATNDAARLDLAVPFLHYWWSNPMQCILVAVLLYQYVYSAGLIGVTVLIVFVPLQSVGAAVMARRRRQAAHHTDTRLRLFQEILAGIRTVKLKGWEGVFLEDLSAIRKLEQSDLSSAQYIRASISMMSVTLPLLAFLLTMVMYHVVMGNAMSQAICVTVIAYFALLRQPLSLMPMVASATSDGRAALGRLSMFLSQEGSVGVHRCLNGTTSKSAIELSNCVFQYSDRSHSIIIDGLLVAKGELIVVTGPVGSGKTTFLHAIMGELRLLKGVRTVNGGSLPLSAQHPWILNMTARENIVFTNEYREDTYGRVLEMCQLQEDLQRLPEGDSTMIGERGANVSGGQKARISLARACYHALVNPDCILLLDDPLSSVDARVARLLIGECIMALDGVTRIIVSSHPQLLQSADRVVLVDHGRATVCEAALSPVSATTTSKKSNSASQLTEPKPCASYSDVRDIGTIQTRVFRKYSEMAGGLKLVIPTVLMAAAQQATRSMSDITASQWAYVQESSHSPWYICVFSAYALSHGVSFFLTASCFISGGLMVGKRLHLDATSSVLYAPLTWIIGQSPGRLTNRLSADLDTVDYVLPESLRSSLVVCANVSATLVLLVVHKWYNVIPIGFVCAVLLSSLQYYRASSREIGRLTAIAKGPLQGHFAETAHGLVSVRSFDAADYFKRRASYLIDIGNQPYFVQFAMQRWLELRVTMAGNVLILLAALSTLLVPGPLALTSATMNKTLTVTRVLNWMIRRMADAEIQFIAVERLVQLGNESVKEPARSEKIPCNGARCDGTIGMVVEFRNVSASYGTAHRALHNVSFTALPGERIGIVGRTGSGKSTLILSLFRAIDPLPGSLILLDGVDTSIIPLPELRRSIATIPQDPFIFTAPIRRNLDPFGEYPDDQIWAALESAGLKPIVLSYPHGLDHVIASSDLSAGHKQLLAAARIILCKPRLLVMDEATANLDADSEQQILQVLSSALPGCTVLTVAHRISAVRGCDRVIVLDGGSVVEEGAPDPLLDDPESRFSLLAAHSNTL